MLKTFSRFTHVCRDDTVLIQTKEKKDMYGIENYNCHQRMPHSAKHGISHRTRNRGNTTHVPRTRAHTHTDGGWLWGRTHRAHDASPMQRVILVARQLRHPLRELLQQLLQLLR